MEAKGLIQAERQKYSSTREMKLCSPTLAGLLELICNIPDREAFQILSADRLSNNFPVFGKFTERTGKTFVDCFRDLWRRLRREIQAPFVVKAQLSMAGTDDILPRPPELSQQEYTWAESLVRESVGRSLDDVYARDRLSLAWELENRIYTMLFVLPFHETAPHWEAMKKLILDDQELREVARRMARAGKARFLSAAKSFGDIERTVHPEAVALEVEQNGSEADAPTPAQMIKEALRASIRNRKQQ